MPKYVYRRDHRAHGGPVLSVCSQASSYSEFLKDFEARWAQKCEEMGYEDDVTAQEEHRLPLLPSNKEIQAEAMTSAALAVKRNIRGVL